MFHVKPKTKRERKIVSEYDEKILMLEAENKRLKDAIHALKTHIQRQDFKIEALEFENKRLKDEFHRELILIKEAIKDEMIHE